MAVKLVVGTNYNESFSDGEGGGAVSFFSYSPNLDENFVSIRVSMNALVDEVRGVQGPNQVLPVDMLTLDDAGGIGVTTNTLIGTESYVPSFVSATRVDVTAGIAMLGASRVAETSATQLSPVVGTDDGGTLFVYIALDVNGMVTRNTAPGSQALDLWRTEVDSTPEFQDTGFQKVGSWQFVLDGDAWVEQCDATGLGSTVTFPIEPAGLPTGRPYDEPKVRINRVERILSGFNTDLQGTPQTIGPQRLLPGTEALPGLILGNGAAINDTGTGVFRPGANRFGISSSGSKSLELTALGQLLLPLNFRVKGERTAGASIADGGALVDLDFTAPDIFDVGSWHDPGGGSPENFTVPTGGAGTYIVTFAFEWAEAITSAREVRAQIQLGGTLIPGGEIGRRLVIGEDFSDSISLVVVLAATNVIKVQVSQDDTVGALALVIDNATLSIVKVA